MPRKTGYKAKYAVGTLVLGNPETGTNAWGTEYDEEYTSSRYHEESRTQLSMQSPRASLRTPRSLKKGYVHGRDYEKLDEQYGQALSAYGQLQLQLSALEENMASMQGNEHTLLQTVEDQHKLIDTLKHQVDNLMDNLGQLMDGVERSRSLMTRLSSSQILRSPPAASRPVVGPHFDRIRISGTGQPQRVANEEKEVPLYPSSIADKMELPLRLSSLEDKVSSIADAIAALSASQALLVKQAQAVQTESGESDVKSDGKKQRDVRGSSRQSTEKIERLPKPLRLKPQNALWKP